MANDQRSLYKPPRACAARGAAFDERKTNLVTRINTDNDLVKDAHATAPTIAGAEIKSGLEKPQYSDPLAAIKALVDAEPDDARAAETVADILFADPLGVMFGIMDAELAEDAEKAEQEIEHLFADFDKRRQARRRRKWPYDWQPYCLVRRPDGTWTMLGREYKRLGTRQDSMARWCDWNAADHVVWRFKCGDPLLLPSGEEPGRIWRIANRAT
jgi:hypothetical protein